MLETRITRLFGIKYPIIAGCMVALSRSGFVAAISNAGALGILASASLENRDQLRAEIRRTKDLTDRPFAVNINLFPTMRATDTTGFIDTALEEGVSIIETSGRSPKDYVARIKEGGAKHMHKCARIRDVTSVAALGADAVTIVGFECGGHPGMDDVTTLVLLPLAVDAVSIPVAAGGGFADGRGLVAALSLGAEAVVMGTRFLATQECPAHDNVKRWMLNARETDTTVIQRTIHSNSRVIKNAPAAKILELEARGASLPEIIAVSAGHLGREAMLGGQLEAGVVTCGQAVGLINDIPTVQDLVESIMRQAEEVRRRLVA